MGIRCSIMHIIEQQLNRKDINITTDLIDETNADSLDMVEIIVDVENEFDLLIPDEKVKLLRTPGDIIFYVQENI
jgi:acyl carrier protein|tara:strand:- start:280 stop:504 length:225 start_codon:yes stop_codon:yes gene_type:complete